MEGGTPPTSQICPRLYARSPLGLAAERGYVECIRILCQHGIDGSNAFAHRLGPLLYACRNGHVECVDLLLQHGVDPNERASLHDDLADSRSSTYAVLLTMQNEQWSNLHSLVKSGARTDVRAGDLTSIVRILLHKHTNPPHLEIPWLIQVRHPVEFMAKLGRVLNIADTTVLSTSLRRCLAVFETHVVFTAASTSANELDDLLDLGADINVTDFTGSTALHLAVTIGNAEAVERLLHKGARTDVYHNTSEAPLWEAVSKRDYEAVELLLNHGANPNLVNSDGRTLLHLVASQGHVETIRALIEAGASVSARDHWSRTPLYLADDEPSAEVLVELGADPSTSRDMPVQTFTKTGKM
jgi:ankyrin repeat protein